MDEQNELLEIYDNYTTNKLEKYKNRGVLKKEVRSYEVSLWTLLDEFITVLKWSDVEQKGRILSPKMTLNVDGTEKFTFSIPMYYKLNGKLIENPNWYNTLNGNLIRGLRKIKVIFNKKKEEEKVFEFVIINITENHENDIKTCEIETEGLAFLELGKIGYKISLSQENFELYYEDWTKNNTWTNKNGIVMTTKPLQTLDFWCEEAGLKLLPASLNLIKTLYSLINSRTWYYTVAMDWKSFLNGNNRASGKVYEEAYPTSWNTEDLTPTAMEDYCEKARAVEIEKSNLYNITLTIAEKFLVFCRYEYIYDENYCIVGRVIVFYNNFILKENEFLGFTYPYDMKKTSRTIESAEVTTKLYVLDTENDTTLEGYNSIMNSPANASREDYILNFDYMLESGGINLELYNLIKAYEIEMRKYNDLLIELLQLQAIYENQIPELEAKRTVAENSIDLDNELIDSNNALLNLLVSLYGDGNTNLLLIIEDKPDYFIVLKHDDGSKFINLRYTNKGIDESTVKIYGGYNSSGTAGHKLLNLITNFTFKHDEEYNNLTEILLPGLATDISHVYLIYSYDPKLYYQNVKKIWQEKLAEDLIAVDEYTQLLGLKEDDPNFDNINNNGLYKKLYKIKNDIRDLINNKLQEITTFEHMMGPALREGYWQPEDYTDYGDYHEFPGEEESGTISGDLSENTDNSLIIGWDTELFDGEDKLEYLVGITENIQYYPCINLTTLFRDNESIPTDLEDYSVVWYASPPDNPNEPTYNDIKNLLVFSIGSLALIKFIKDEHQQIIPVLVLVGAKTLADSVYTRLTGTEGFAVIEKYSVTVENGNVQVNHINSVKVMDSEAEYNNFISVSNALIVYPRIKCSSLSLKTDTSNLSVHYGGQLLNFAEDYYINVRAGANAGYYITIKPSTLIKQGYTEAKELSVNYVLSNANTAIYLDALKISKENASPKVSYEITTNILNDDLTYSLYNRRAQIIMINDTELKFNDVFGYISGIELDLDLPQNDTIEVKNYKSKFEDLFSTIVAQTEEMKRSSGNLFAAAEGSMPLSGEGFESTLSQNSLVLLAYLDSYFDSSLVVKDRLTELFTEAGEILSDSNKALNSVKALTLENASILASFALNISEELGGKVYRSKTKPESFKPNDIWILIDNNGNEIARYIATAFSSESGSGETAGFVRTYDGTLASITGASLNIDALAGLIDIEAQNQINIKSGGYLYLAGENVDIVGNKQVNIGGTTINIATITKEGENYNYGGINLIAGAPTDKDNSLVSKILINPTKIEMGAAELILKAASKLDLYASDGTVHNTAAIRISADEGVWIGSGKSVRLFSGDVKLNNDGTVNTASTGANIELNNEHLILGYSADSSAQAIEMKKEYLIIASGDIINSNSSKKITGITGTSSGLVGAKFTKDSIGFAVGSGNNISAVLMNGTNGITIGSGSVDVTKSSATLKAETEANLTVNNVTDGSYTRIGSGGIELGSLADLYINTTNFKLLTNSRAKENNLFVMGKTILAVGNNLQYIDENTGYDATTGTLRKKSGSTYTNLTATPDVDLLLNLNGLYIRGTVYAAAGSFTGSVTATSFTLNDNNAYTIATTYALNISYTTKPADSAFTYTSKPTISLIETYANTLSNTNKEKIYLWTKITTTLGQNQSTSIYSCEHVNADGTTNTIIVEYTIHSAAEVPSNATWSSTKPTATSEKPFLITRTRIFLNYAWATTYTFSKLVDDADISPYVESIKILYWLKTNSNEPTDYSSGTHTEVTRTDDVKNAWTLAIPTYSGTTTSTLIYYTCELKKWVNHTPTLEWTAPIQNYGLTVANQKATAASKDAADAASSVEPITNYGLAGTTIWNNKTYDLVLGNNKTHPMLIGSNSGITICDTNLKSGVPGQGASLVLDSGGIALHGTTINFTTVGSTTNALVLDNTGITMGTSGNIKLLSNNIILDSTATGTNSIFELKKKASDWTELNNHYDTALKYSITGGLEVTGKITATSFTLGSTEIELDSLGHLPSSLIDTSSYSVNGISTIKWGSPANLKKSYVGLTSNMTGGLLIGADRDVIIPFVAPNGNDEVADDINTVVKINKNGVLFDTHLDEAWASDEATYTKTGTWESLEDGTYKYKLTSGTYYTGWLYKDSHWYYLNSDGIRVLNKVELINSKRYYFNSEGQIESSHVYITDDGIEMVGPRLKMNGQDAWGRDDIIILHAGSGQTIANAEAAMAGKHDWVLIKPYYNAEVAYFNNTMCWMKANYVDLLLDTLELEPLLGDGASSYTVTFKCEVSLNLAATSSLGMYSHYLIVLYYKQKGAQEWNSRVFSGGSNGNGAYQDGGDAITFGSASGFDFIEDTNQQRHHISISMPLPSNICYSDYLMDIYIRELVGTLQTILSGILVIFKCDATTSRVPCTVYYYP